MKCPYCAYNESKVIDSRPTEDDEKIRRRRECLSCGKRFTTYEIVETTPLMVIKKDRSRQMFDREKLLRGLIRACDKRPVTAEMLDGVVDRIEQGFVNRMVREVSSEELGEQALLELKKLDKVAYIRFASVYRDFSDVATFLDELQKLQSEE
jgi:transcriptional repressor NrdR